MHKWYQRTTADLLILNLNHVLFLHSHMCNRPEPTNGPALFFLKPSSLPVFPVAAVACDEAKTLTFIVIPAEGVLTPGCRKKATWQKRRLLHVGLVDFGLTTKEKVIPLT